MAESLSPDALKFFVYIVESPSAPDIYHGRSEGSLVARAVALDGIPCVARTAISKTAFIAALKLGLPDAMKAYPGLLPVLHISAHGASFGTQLSDGTVLSWSDIRDLILPINESLNGTLLLCMSACEGYSACQMAMRTDDAPHPYLGLIANFGKPTWSDTAVAYSAFYHLISKGRSIPEAVAAMRAASGDDGWIVETAEQAKQGFLEFVKQTDVGKAQQELQSDAETADVPPDAKALEKGQGR